MNEELQKQFDIEREEFENLKKITFEKIREEKLMLQEERKLLERKKESFRKMKENFNNKLVSDNIVEINIGGEVFTTLQSTLSKNKNSLLASLVSSRQPLARDEKGRIYMDRNGAIFHEIMNYLRTDKYPESFANDTEEKSFLIEMDYYGLKPLPQSIISTWHPQLHSTGLLVRDDGATIEVTGESGDHIGIIGNDKISAGIVSVSILVTIPRPNRYSIGFLPDVPPSFNKGFAYKNGVNGWGLHDHTSSLGIFCQTQLTAPSTLGYGTNDIVTMILDVDRGNLFFKVNGIPCAQLLNQEQIRQGGYLAATLFNKYSVWRIVNL